MTERDPDFDALWRRHSTETPPAALDDAIRAAAHRAVHAKPSATLPRARAPWPAWATFAAAASIGAIAIGVWQLQPRDVDETQMVASDVPARAGAPRPVVTPPEPKATPTPNGSQTAAPTAPVKLAPTPGGLMQPAPPPDGSGAGKPASVPNRFGRKEETTPTPDGLPPPAADALDRKTTPTPNDPAKEAVVARDKQTTLTPNSTLTPNLANPSPFPGVGDAAPVESMPSVVATPSAPRMASAPMATKRNADAKRFEADATRADADAASTDAGSSQSGASAPRAQAGNVAALAQRGALRSVDDFVDAIRRALAEHRDADAVSALATMRAQYSDADSRLPADLRAWAARVQRTPVQ